MPPLFQLIRSINRVIGLLCGVILLATAAFVLIEITLRALSLPYLGGADEYGGYVMAIVTAWGLSFALTEGAHIRIDMIVRRTPVLMRDLVDVMALSSIAAVATTVSVYGWNVVGKSLKGMSRANTPLETPLWIPQMIWWSGWVWFAVSACLITLIAMSLTIRRQSVPLREIAGVADEQEVTS